MTKGLIIGKFYPPHLGHKYLIDFARNYSFSHIDVIVFGMESESISTWLRYNALREHYDRCGNVLIHHHEETLPQYPEEHPDFWNIWKDRITKKVNVDSDTILFASENYGIKLAEVLGCKFIPVDTDRNTYSISGTEVRKNIDWWFDKLLPEMKKYLTKKVVFFGSDSVGKTTMSKIISRSIGGKFVPEYARTYLNTYPSETITKDMMHDIARGQLAAQKSDYRFPEKYLTVFDTDFLTTYGYWKLFGFNEDEKFERYVAQHILYSRNYHYIVLDTNIPFEVDAQRYGGNQRQSDTQFWINILQKFRKPHTLITESNMDKRIGEIVEIVNNINFINKDEVFN